MNTVRRQIFWDTVCNRCYYGYREKGNNTKRTYCSNFDIEEYYLKGHKIDICKGKYFKEK